MHWLLAQIESPGFVLQVILLLLAGALALWLGGLTVTIASVLTKRLKIPPWLSYIGRYIGRQRFGLTFVLILWLVINVGQRTVLGFQATLLSIALNLATAWVVIKLATGLIGRGILSKIIAFIAWGVAALNIVGLLEPIIAALDEAAFEAGDFRLSALTLLRGFIVMGMMLWAVRLFGGLIEGWLKRMPDMSPSSRVLLSKISNLFLIVIAIIVTLNTIGIDLTALAVFSGALGVGIGLGLQRFASNLFGGISLLVDKSIKPGDVIELEGTFGRVEKLAGRYISVVTRDNKEILVPNEQLIGDRVINWSYSDKKVRQEIAFGVHYDSNPFRVRELAVEAASIPDRVLKIPPPICHFHSFGDSSLDFKLRYWIDDPENGLTNIRGDIMLELWRLFWDNGIKIPYPYRSVIVENAASPHLDPQVQPSTQDSTE